jgi:hypothetical protein
MNIGQIAKKPENLKKPYNSNNYNYDIEDVFNFVIHGDVCIDSP